MLEGGLGVMPRPPPSDKEGLDPWEVPAPRPGDAAGGPPGGGGNVGSTAGNQGMHPFSQLGINNSSRAYAGMYRGYSGGPMILPSSSSDFVPPMQSANMATAMAPSSYPSYRTHFGSGSRIRETEQGMSTLPPWQQPDAFGSMYFRNPDSVPSMFTNFPHAERSHHYTSGTMSSSLSGFVDAYYDRSYPLGLPYAGTNEYSVPSRSFQYAPMSSIQSQHGSHPASSSFHSGRTERDEERRGRKKTEAEPGKGQKRRQPLTAYNIFFSEQRDSILEEIEAKEAGIPVPPKPPNYRPSILDRSVVKKKRVHRKVHGKINLFDLTKTIGKRWQSLSQRDRQKYVDWAEEDRQKRLEEAATSKSDDRKPSPKNEPVATALDSSYPFPSQRMDSAHSSANMGNHHVPGMHGGGPAWPQGAPEAVASDFAPLPTVRSRNPQQERQLVDYPEDAAYAANSDLSHAARQDFISQQSSWDAARADGANAAQVDGPNQHGEQPQRGDFGPSRLFPDSRGYF